METNKWLKDKMCPWCKKIGTLKTNGLLLGDAECVVCNNCNGKTNTDRVIWPYQDEYKENIGKEE